MCRSTELSTDKGVVVHAKSKRRISYGDVVKFAKVPDEPPKIAEADLKKKSQFKLIGRKDIGRIDVPLKANGTAKYGIDVQVPGMIYASVLEAPVEGAKVTVQNAEEVGRIKGVTRVLPLPFGVAVLGDTVEATRAGRNALKVTWDKTGTAAANTNSVKGKEDYAKKGKDPNATAITEYKVGDAAKALGTAAITMEATYWSEYCYHAQMEPMNAVAKVSDDGQSAEIWTGTQFGALAANIIAGVLKTTPDKIKVHQQMLGGGYGRRLWPDAAIQATILSNITKKPVKLILTREDDVVAARPRPMTHHVMKAGLDAKGNLWPGITAWCRRTSMRWPRRRASRRPAARTTSARAASIRRSMRSRTCRPNTCARSAACGCTPGAASARATTSLRRSRSSTRWRTPPARTRSTCGWR